MEKVTGKVLEASAAHLEIEPIGITKAEVERGLAPMKPVGPIRMMDNPLEGFRNGASLDLRVRFAMELLAHNPNFGPLYDPDGELDPCLTATFALDVSAKLFDIAQSRGLIEPFAEFEASPDLKAQGRRQIAYQVYAQKEGMKLQAENTPMVRAVPSPFNQ